MEEHMSEKKETQPYLPPDVKSLNTALLVGIYNKREEKQECEEHLDELERLCETFGLRAVGKVSCPIKRIDAGTYVGKGKLEDLIKMGQSLDADVILFDDEISPQQQRNLEGLFRKPVMDRTELILEVFVRSARTREARLQIE